MSLLQSETIKIWIFVIIHRMTIVIIIINCVNNNYYIIVKINLHL